MAVFIILGMSSVILHYRVLTSDRLVWFKDEEFRFMLCMGTCGFVNTLDYDRWSTAAKMALIMVVLVGGCIGSTAGGIKVGRLLVDCKYAYNELRHMLHPMP